VKGAPHRESDGASRAALVFGALVPFLSLGLDSCISPPHGSAGAASPPTEKLPAVDVPPLRSVAGARRIGAALEARRLREPAFAALLAANFNSLTPENEMKWANVEPSPGLFSFQAGDALVAFAEQNGMRVRGHTLVWHQQFAPWVAGLSGEALRAAMIRHVSSVVSHWKGKISQWDVVNEAFADGPGGGLRGDSPFTALGPTFIDDAFRAAHEADPAAQLFYNDYELEDFGTAKTEAVYQMARRLKAAGVPLGGVGFQMHVDPRHWPAAAVIRQTMERFAALGLAVEITEMDVPVGEMKGELAQRLEQQKRLAHDIVAACVAVSACSGVTFWGVTDRYSWLNAPQWARLFGRGPHFPLPFDGEYGAKPMAAGIAAALAGN
jgi:endo-1,4-beta-xylanase